MRPPRRAHVRRLAALVIGLALLAIVVAAGPALAAAPATSSFAPPIANGVGDLLSGIANTVLGGVDWTVDVAGDFILNLLGGLVRDLIPRCWIHKGLDIMTWLVAVPDYTARVSTPGGGHSYGFAGVNAMRGLYLWLGMAIAPLTLVYATSRAWSGQGDPPHVPLVRVLVVAIALLSYTWRWSQAVALTNQVTHAILGVSAVTSGVQKMFEVLIAGAALGGMPLVGLLVMGVGGLQLLAMVFVKVTLILIGALVFAIGPLMIGLVPIEHGNAFARTWLTIARGLFVLPILWASIFALAAVLINDAARGASVIGGNSGLGETLGGLLIAMAAIAGFWLNIKLTKGFAGLVGGQLAGLLALAGGGARALIGGGGGRRVAAACAAASAAGGGVTSLRGFASKVGGGAAGAAAALVPAGRAGAAVAGAGTLARGGLIGAGGALASKAIAAAASSGAGRVAASSRAGSVATRAARGARRGSSAAPRSSSDAASPAPTPTADHAVTGPADAAPTTRSSSAPGRCAAHTPDPQRVTRSRQTRGERQTPLAVAPAEAHAHSQTSPAPREQPRHARGRQPTGDATNDAARDAFGRPPAPKPTRSVRHPFRGTAVMTATLRRLDDGTRYYSLTWRQWAAALTGGGLLYLAVRFSPLSEKWTFTAALLILATLAVAILPLTGNALGLDRYLAAIVRWSIGPKHYTPRAPAALRGGVLLSTVPVALADT